MSPARKADSDLDRLIDEIIVDAYDEDEQLMGFEVAFDEGADFPCSRHRRGRGGRGGVGLGQEPSSRTSRHL